MNFKKLMTIDRRIIFIIIALGVAIPLLKALNLPIQTTPPVKNIYDHIEKLNPGDKVLISFDYGPSTKPELQPMGEALIRHCLKKDVDVVAVALWPMGVKMCQEAFNVVGKEFPDKKYGKNFVNMGYKSGGIVTIKALCSNFPNAFPQDANTTSYLNMELTKDIRDINSFEYIHSLSAGDPGIIQWTMIASDNYNKAVGGGCTAVSAPSIYPYVGSGQLVGLMGGLKGAAEYETLIDIASSATRGMDAQSVAHIIIIIFIIIGNIGYFIERKQQEQKS